VHRLTLGDFELTILSDGNYFLDGGAFFGVIPKVMWSKRMQPDELNRLSCGLNSVLVRGATKTVLIETGIGNKLGERMKKIYAPEEKLLNSLHAVGVAPEEIDVVINTHLHFDHCGWNTVYRDGRAVPTFPNAKYYVQRGEWEYAQRASERDRIFWLMSRVGLTLDTKFDRDHTLNALASAWIARMPRDRKIPRTAPSAWSASWKRPACCRARTCTTSRTPRWCTT